MKNLFSLIFIVLFSTVSFSATKGLQGNQWINNDGSKSWLPPLSSGTLSTLNGVETFNNKTLNSPTINTPTGILKGDVGLGNVDNTSDATKNAAVKTLTNTTLSSPVINTPTVNVESFTEQGSTPSTPAAGTRKIYAKSDGVYHLDSAGLEKKVGSGSGGGENWITDSDAASAASTIISISKYTAASRPPATLTSSGTPGLSSSIVTVGTEKVFSCVHPASNTQGEACEIPVAVPLVAQKTPQYVKIKVPYYVASGTFDPGSNSLDGDLIGYVGYYDSGSSSWKSLEPQNIKFDSSQSGFFQAEFQTIINVTQYKVLLYSAKSTATAYTLHTNKPSVAPSQYVYATTDTGWIAYTPTFTNLGTVTLAEAFYKRVGDSIMIRGRAVLGTTVGSIATFSFPTGLTTDAVKNTIQTAFGGKLINNGAATNFTTLSAPSATGVTFGTITGSAGLSSATGTTIGSSGNTIAWETGLIPITGWSSASQVSDDYQARDLRVNVNRATNLTGINPNNSAVKLAIAPTSVDDTYGGWDSANNRVNIKAARTYDITYGAWIENSNVASGAYYIIQLMQNGVEIDSSQMQYTSVISQYMRLPGSKKGVVAKPGDYFEVWIYTSANHSSSTLVARKVWLDVQSVQTSQTVSATEVVAANFSSGSISSTAGVAFTGFSSKLYDTHNIVNLSTGEIKISAPGFYRITAPSIRSVAGQTLNLWKNGVSYRSFYSWSFANGWLNGSLTVQCVSGDILTLRPDGSVTVLGMDVYIERVK